MVIIHCKFYANWSTSSYFFALSKVVRFFFAIVIWGIGNCWPYDAWATCYVWEQYAPKVNTISTIKAFFSKKIVGPCLIYGMSQTSRNCGKSDFSRVNLVVLEIWCARPLHGPQELQNSQKLWKLQKRSFLAATFLN